MKIRSSLAGLAAFVCAGALCAADSGRHHGRPVPGAVTISPVTAGVAIERPADFGPSGDSVSTFFYAALRPIDTSFTTATNGTSVWPTSM